MGKRNEVAMTIEAGRGVSTAGVAGGREPSLRASPSAAPSSWAASSQPPAPTGPPDAGDTRASAFAAVLRGVGREVEHGESLVRSALGAARSGAGGTMPPGDLIALQAGVYRYGEAVDLASRLVDRATSSVKTVLQGQ
jgi:hypothetical protein